MIIRKATIDDAAEIANVHVNSWREAYKGLLPQDFLDNRPLHFKNRYELWKRVTTDKKQTTIVAESDDFGVIGFINGYKARDEKFSNYIEIYSFYLLKKFHRQKIGFQLLKTFFKAEYKRGYRKSYLWVLKDNPTIGFYERTGAIFSGDTKKDVIGSKDVEELCYTWSIIEGVGERD